MITAFWLLAIGSCIMTPKFSLQPQLEKDVLYPLEVKISDIASKISDGKYTGFTGFSCTIKGSVRFQIDSIGPGKHLFVLEDFSLDTIREVGSLYDDLLDLNASFKKLLINRIFQYPSTGADPFLFTHPIADILQELREFLTKESYLIPSSGQEDSDQMHELVKSLYTLPYNPSKGTAWHDEAKLTLIKSDPAEIIPIQWEIIRSNNQEFAFLGKGSKRILMKKEKTDPHLLDDLADVKRFAFMINPVLYPQSHWIQAGTIELKIENALLLKKTEKDSPTDKETLNPISTRQIRWVFKKAKTPR